MKLKKILFIDDEDLSEYIETIERNIKSQGLRLHADVVNPKSKEFETKNPVSGAPETSFIKLQQKLESEFFSTRYDIVACDFDFSNDSLNGYDVIRWIINTSISKRATIRKALFVSYSSDDAKFKK